MADPIDTNRMISRCQDWGNDDAEQAAREMCDEIDRLRAELQEARREGYRLTSLDLESCITEVDRLRAENDRLRAVVLAGQEARAVEQDEPFDHEHAEAAWAAYDVAVERLEADRG